MTLYGYGIALYELPSLQGKGLYAALQNISKRFSPLASDPFLYIEDLDDLFTKMEEYDILGTEEFPMTYHSIADVSYLVILARMPWDYPVTFPQTEEAAIQKFDDLFKLLYGKKIDIVLDMVDDCCECD